MNFLKTNLYNTLITGFLLICASLLKLDQRLDVAIEEIIAPVAVFIFVFGYSWYLFDSSIAFLKENVFSLRQRKQSKARNLLKERIDQLLIDNHNLEKSMRGINVLWSQSIQNSHDYKKQYEDLQASYKQDTDLLSRKIKAQEREIKRLEGKLTILADGWERNENTSRREQAISL